MTAAELLKFAHAHDIDVEAEGDRLQVNAPAGALTPELCAELARHKAALLIVLARATEFVELRGGLIVPRQVIELMLDLERRGFSQSLDAHGALDVQPKAALTETDLLKIHRWWRHMIAIINYAPEATRQQL